MTLECGQPEYGEVFAEVAQGLRNAVVRGDLSAEQALKISEQTLRNFQVWQSAEPRVVCFERRSTQLDSLMTEGERLKEILLLRNSLARIAGWVTKEKFPSN